MNRSLVSLIIATTVTLWLTEGVAFAGDPTTADCLTASNASLDLGNQHKLRAKRSQLLICGSASCPADIRDACVSRVSEVNTEIPTIVFAAKDSSSGADLTAVKVTMDGEVLVGRLEGTALSVDPGEHTFTFDVAGQPSVTKKLVIQQGQKDRREQISFGTPTAPALVGVPVATAEQAPLSSPTKTRRGIGTQKVLAVVAGGAGLIGLGVGTAFGVISISKHSDAQAACPTSQCATSSDVNLWNEARSAGNISTAALVAGGVLLAGGAVLWFTTGKPRSDAALGPEVGLGFGNITLRGTW
jgi:hypothetical protein